MKRALGALALAGVLAAAAWQGAEALQADNETAVAPTPAEPPSDSPPVTSAPKASAAAPQPLVKTDTPMRERIAVLGLLNKRNGISRDLKMHPGDAVRVGDVIVRLRACETTAPWEPEQLTGAFVQVDVHGRDDKWRRIFSGWLYKETPSLNVVENQIYDVWPKSCAMKHPDAGPDTVSAGVIDGSGASRSSAKKSAETPEESAEPAAAPSAVSNNAT